MKKQLLEKQYLHEANFIYSIWPGYLERDPKFRRFCDTYQIPMTAIHTSGHAYIDDLKRLGEALNLGVFYLFIRFMAMISKNTSST